MEHLNRQHNQTNVVSICTRCDYHTVKCSWLCKSKSQLLCAPHVSYHVCCSGIFFLGGKPINDSYLQSCNGFPSFLRQSDTLAFVFHVRGVPSSAATSASLFIVFFKLVTVTKCELLNWLNWLFGYLAACDKHARVGYP